jgi:hypothetical protein
MMKAAAVGRTLTVKADAFAGLNIGAFRDLNFLLKMEGNDAKAGNGHCVSIFCLSSKAKVFHVHLPAFNFLTIH